MPKGIPKSGKRNRDNKKDDILRAAMKIYAFYGFEGATLERMATSAGVSKSLILKLFGSKQEMVREMASVAVQDNMAKIRHIDEDPDITLREREDQVFGLLKPDREEWCLIFGTLLVPNFQFAMRSEIEGYIEMEHQAIKNHVEELKDQSPDAIFSLSYALSCLRIGYVVDGKEQNYRKTATFLLDQFLIPG